MLIKSFNGNLGDALLNEKQFNTLDDVRRQLPLWRFDDNNVRPDWSLKNKTPAEACRALELSEGFAPDALAQPETDGYQTRRLSV